MWQIWLICAVGLLPLYLLMPASAAAAFRRWRERARVSMDAERGKRA